MELIHSYTRQNAIDDGFFVDVTEVAREAGFRLPTAVTGALYHTLEIVPEGNVSSLDRRLRNLLRKGWFAIRNSKDEASSELIYDFLIVMEAGREPELLKVKLVVGPGDEGEPVITIMLPHED